MDIVEAAFIVINLMYILAILCQTHSLVKRGWRPSIIITSISVLFGLLWETYNIQFGHYSYPVRDYDLYIGSVSVSILVSWYAVTYIGMTFSDLIFQNFNVSKEAYFELRYIRAPLHGIIAATFVIILDPVASQVLWWNWKYGEVFLNVPLGEIFGIFIAVTIISYIYLGLQDFLQLRKTKEWVDGSYGLYHPIDVLLPLYYVILLIFLVGYSFEELPGNVANLLASSFIIILLLVSGTKKFFESDFGQEFLFTQTSELYRLSTIALLGTIVLILGALTVMAFDGPINDLHMVLGAILLILFAPFATLVRFQINKEDKKKSE